MRSTELPVSAILEPCVLTNFLVVLVAGEVHAKNRVVVIRTRKLGGGVRDQHLDQFLDINTALTDDLYADALGDVSIFDDGNIFFSHGIFLSNLSWS